VSVKRYCRFCDVDNFESVVQQDNLDKRVGELGLKRFNEWLKQQGMPTCGPSTFYKHRDHVTHPQDRIVSAVEKRQREGGVQPAQTTHEEFLESLVSIGAAKVSADPDAVTVDQALKAAKIVSDNAKKGGGTNILVQLFTDGGSEPTIIEGEATKVS
jgi:GGDEF domain-containing protein